MKMMTRLMWMKMGEEEKEEDEEEEDEEEEDEEDDGKDAGSSNTRHLRRRPTLYRLAVGHSDYDFNKNTNKKKNFRLNI